jgi:hypothetical protein
MRVTLPRASLLVLLSVGTALASDQSTTPPPASLHGELAFSKTISFDYDRDGTRDRVQFWIEIQGEQAIGEPGTPGARPESGSVSYFVVDLANKRRIDNWLLGFNMGGLGGGFPVAGQPYPLTNISITDKTARFDLNGSTWTIVDLGKTWKKDKIEIETGGRIRDGRFYGGDVTVTPGPPAPPKPAPSEAAGSPPPGEVPAVAAASPVPAAAEGTAAKATEAPVLYPPADIKANSKCNKCHEEAAGTIAAMGGPHARLKCASCHDKHPRDVDGAKPACTRCHNSHDESIRMGSCSDCHSSHAVTDIQYGIGIPDTYCEACHRSSAKRLKESGTRHMGLACAICHRTVHGSIPSCVDCHGAPHNKRMMSKPERCVACHEGAHQTSVDR